MCINTKHVHLSPQRPLALAKILGAYSIGFKNSRTGSSKRMDVVVMENLLYNHSIARVRITNTCACGLANMRSIAHQSIFKGVLKLNPVLKFCLLTSTSNHIRSR